ncbi:MAG: hypothetical protein IT340_20190 [Chloroflexi bacterium]|nr:hypothetical protein [Chloroflexota bacterium]
MRRLANQAARPHPQPVQVAGQPPTITVATMAEARAYSEVVFAAAVRVVETAHRRRVRPGV